MQSSFYNATRRNFESCPYGCSAAVRLAHTLWRRKTIRATLRNWCRWLALEVTERSAANWTEGSLDSANGLSSGMSTDSYQVACRMATSAIGTLSVRGLT